MSASPARKFVTPAATTTVKSIEDFWHVDSANPQEDRRCNACGGLLGYVKAYCWLDGANVASVIELPVCRNCNPDVLTALRRRGRLLRDGSPLS